MISCFWNYDIIDDISITWYHKFYDIIYDLTYDFIVSPPTPFGHVRWQIRWQSNDFNVSIPSCTGELGRGEELSLAEGGERNEVLESWGELGRAWGLGRGRCGEERSLAVARNGLGPWCLGRWRHLRRWGLVTFGRGLPKAAAGRIEPQTMIWYVIS